MKFIFSLLMVFSLTSAFAGEIDTDCPYLNQDNRSAGKNIKSQEKSKVQKPATGTAQ